MTQIDGWRKGLDIHPHFERACRRARTEGRPWSSEVLGMRYPNRGQHRLSVPFHWRIGHTCRQATADWPEAVLWPMGFLADAGTGDSLAGAGPCARRWWPAPVPARTASSRSR